MTAFTTSECPWQQHRSQTLYLPSPKRPSSSAVRGCLPSSKEGSFVFHKHDDDCVSRQTDADAVVAVREVSHASTAITTKYESSTNNSSSLRERKKHGGVCSLEQLLIRKTKTYLCFVVLKRARRKARRGRGRENSSSALLFGITEDISMRRRVET